MAVALKNATVKVAKICQPNGEKGLFFPLGPDWEQSWPTPLQIVLYGLALGWFFLGVAIIADVFMNAIETITSKKKRIYVKETGRYRTIKVWNETVANLTLMALGSSAPEILLNVVEVGRNEFFAGALGPGTIVGSAAFNLLVISAVCVVAIPSGEYRVIKDVAVYSVTAAFSVFAYIWLIIVLMMLSPDIVEWWEAIITFLYFPMLIIISFAADKGWISGVPAMANRQRVVAAEMTKEELAEIVKSIRTEFGDLDDNTMSTLIEKRTAARPSKAQIRADRSKPQSLSSSNTWSNSHSTKTKDLGLIPIGQEESSRMSRLSSMIPDQATVEFKTTMYAIKEGDGKCIAEVVRTDHFDSKITVKYRTKDGTAKAGDDYIATEGTLTFDPTVDCQVIEVTILDDDEWESAEDFSIELFEVECEGGTCILGRNNVTNVTIIDDDDPGCFTFEHEFIKHDADATEELVINVLRNLGSKGVISCNYKTEDDSAVSGLDFEPVDDRLEFKGGSMSGTITLRCKARGRYTAKETFRLILSDAIGGRFDSKADGDETMTTCTIELGASERNKATVDRMADTLGAKHGGTKSKIAADRWKEQFVEAIYCGGSKEEQKESSNFDFALHVASMPWKLLFALVPPPVYAGGWACFCCALMMIGVVTACIGDLAMCFGCSLNMPDQITAITFVALGTSLPDTFASKTAATQDPYADASITNITGSNSVNVFLGLGLPWTVAALYWTINGPNDEWNKVAPDSVKKWVGDKDKAVYVLEAADLGFSVGVFTACALCAMAALAVRRKLFKGELGGPHISKLVSGAYLVVLWFIYIAASWTYIEVTKD